MAGATAGEQRVQTRLGPHLLTDLLHETSVRAIYRAVQIGTEREVLLMVLAEPLAEDPRIRDGFGPRMRQASGVLERHLVPLQQWGTIDGLLCVELGLLSGTGLETLLADEPMEPRRAVDLVADLAAATDAAHTRGLAHLGLSPTTVVVGHDDVARVTDLGLAALLVAAGVEPEPVDRPYRAPELSSDVDPGSAAGVRADVFSLTALLHDALTGIGPAAREPLLSPSMVGLLQRGTGRPGERPHSGGELVRAARFALQDESEPMRLSLRRPPVPSGPGPGRASSPTAVPAPPLTAAATSSGVPRADVAPYAASPPSVATARPVAAAVPARGRGGSSAVPVLATVLVVLALIAVAGFLWLLFDPAGPTAQQAVPATAAPTPAGAPATTSDAERSPAAGPPEPTTTPTPATPTGASATPTPSDPELPASARECVADAAAQNGLTGSAVGSANTSCEFAEATRTVLAASEDPFAVTEVRVTSPVTEEDYPLTCSASSGSSDSAPLITCTGGNNAVVLVW